MKTTETFHTQLISVNVKKKGEARITFACDKEAFMKLEELRSAELPLDFWVEGAELEKLSGAIVSITSTSSGSFPRKFVIETPESEKMRVAELTSLMGAELNIIMEIMQEDKLAL